MSHENTADGSKPRRHYDENYKRHAVELTLQGGRTIGAVARELGVAVSMLYDWRGKYAPGRASRTARRLRWRPRPRKSRACAASWCACRSAK